MTDAMHTPGPWYADENGMTVWGKSVGGCRMEMATHKIADIRGWGHLSYLGKDEAIVIQKANAALIAAAPDLLSALELILPLAKGYSPAGQTASAKKTCREWIAAAEAAIAKATP